MGTRELVIRADATSETGAGHVMRCCALAEEWLKAKRGEVSLVGSVLLPFARSRLRALGISVDTEMSWQGGKRDSILLVDTYSPAIRTEWQEKSDFRLRVLVDDLGGNVGDGYDAIWNPNPYGDRGLYHGFQGEVIAGWQTVPLRAHLPRWKSNRSRVVVVLLGGSRISGILITALRDLATDHPELHFCGAGDWVPKEWKKLTEGSFWSEASKCERLITAAGSTVYEAGNVGIPTLLVCIASNQRMIYEWGCDAGVPGIEAIARTDVTGLAIELGEGLQRARTLPKIPNGSPRVIARLGELCEQ